MDKNDWRTLRRMPLFSGMNDAIVEQVIGGARPRVYEKGTSLFTQGAPAKAFYLILDGWVRVFRTTPNGEETILSVFQAGESFAEGALFLHGFYPASADTVTPARLLAVDGASLRRAINANPDIAFLMLGALSHHLKEMIEQVELLKSLSAPQRLAEFLFRLGPPAEKSFTVKLPFGKALLARRLGMKPESLSRAFQRLQPVGVQVERDEVIIDDVEKLLRFASSDEP